MTNRDMTGNSEHERIQRAYQRGHAEGRQQARHDLLPFTGVNTAMIAFPDVQPIHQAVIEYEATLTKALPALIGQAHHALEEQRRHAEQALQERDDLAADLADRRRQRQEMRGVLGTLARARGKERDRRDEHRLLTGLADQDETFTQRRENAAAAAAEVEHELALVRAWLDTWVDAAQEYAGRRADLRRETTAPPPSVRIYPSAQAFADEDPRRASPAYESLRLGGADFGYRWTWQDVEQPWRTSKWRVSWLGNLGEVYAVLLEDDVEAQHWQPLRPEPQAPVWLLKTGLRSKPGTTAVWDWLASLERRLQTQRNSLLALAEALDAPTPLNDDEGLARHEGMDETSAK